MEKKQLMTFSQTVQALLQRIESSGDRVIGRPALMIKARQLLIETGTERPSPSMVNALVDAVWGEIG